MSQSRLDKIRSIEQAIKVHRDRIDAFILERGGGRRRINDALIVMFEGHSIAKRLLDEIMRAHMEVVMAIEELYDPADRTTH